MESAAALATENFDTQQIHSPVLDEAALGQAQVILPEGQSGAGIPLAMHGAHHPVDLFSVNLAFFSGPMDLLLHLVHQQEVPIEKVSMKLVTEQYLEIITGRAGNLDLEKAGEYLLIAATLLAIKSGSLLPQAVVENGEELPETERVDYRFFEDLRARLRSYELTKRQAVALIESPQLGVDTFSRYDRKALLPTPEMLAEPEEVFTLGMLFSKLLRRIGLSGLSLKIALEPVSVVSMMMKIIDGLSGAGGQVRADFVEGKSKSFRQVAFSLIPKRILQRLKDSSERTAGLEQVRSLVIAGFIATLELVKRGVLAAKQGNDDSDLEVSLRMETAVDSMKVLESEFDAPVSQDPISPGVRPLLQPLVNDDSNALPGAGVPNKVVHIADYRAAAKLAESACAQLGRKKIDITADPEEKHEALCRGASNVSR